MLLLGKSPLLPSLSKQKAASMPFLHDFWSSRGQGTKRPHVQPNVTTLLTFPIRDDHTVFLRTSAHAQINTRIFILKKSPLVPF